MSGRTFDFRRGLFIFLCLTGLRIGTAPVHAQQTQPSQPPQQSQQPAKPPLPNRVNEHLPSWLRVRGEFRERTEGFAGAGFVADRDDMYWLSRFRLNATVTPANRLSFQVQVQDARVANKQIGPTGTPFKAPFDLRMAFGDVGTAKSRVTLRVGRQELAFGEQRLVGHVSWLNAARTFDAVRLTWRGKGIQVDGFGASVVRIIDGEFDRSGNGNRFGGAYAVASSLVPKGTVEPYFFWRGDRSLRVETGGFGNLRLATTGVRWAGKLPAAFDYSMETAMQTGSLGTDSIRAWGGHYQVRTPAGPRSVRATFEYNYASGDRSATDGRRGTFDNLYPTPHEKYGLADQVGWRNIQHLRIGGEVTPVKGWPVGANFHSWWLAQKTDGLYNAGGAVIAKVPGGAASSHVGQEIDLQVTRALSPQFQIAGGYAHIFPGGFLKQATPGASYSYPYLMATYVFLAEK